MLCSSSRTENIISDPDLGKIGEEKRVLMSWMMELMNGICGPSGVRVKKENLEGGSTWNCNKNNKNQNIRVTKHDTLIHVTLSQSHLTSS